MEELKFVIDEITEMVEDLRMSKADYGKKYDCEVTDAEAVRRVVEIRMLCHIKNELERAVERPTKISNEVDVL